jgi:hypothetical protein
MCDFLGGGFGVGFGCWRAGFSGVEWFGDERVF